MRRLFMRAIFLLLCAGLWADEVFTYRMQKDKEADTITMTVIRTDGGGTVRESQDQGNEERTEEIDSDNSTRAFHFRNLSAGTDYRAERMGSRILVTGTRNNRALTREFSINEEPWYQFPEQALGNSPPLAQGSAKFWLINADECEIHEMEAVPVGAESISIMGAPVQARKIQVKLTGFASLFWSALYWFGPTDEPYLRHETTEGPLRGPTLVIELVSRESHHE
jgi:hypothetical protein